MKTSCQGDKDLVLLALVSLSDGLGSYRSLAITEALAVSLSLSLSLSTRWQISTTPWGGALDNSLRETTDHCFTSVFYFYFIFFFLPFFPSSACSLTLFLPDTRDSWRPVSLSLSFFLSLFKKVMDSWETEKETVWVGFWRDSANFQNHSKLTKEKAFFLCWRERKKKHAHKQTKRKKEKNRGNMIGISKNKWR